MAALHLHLLAADFAPFPRTRVQTVVPFASPRLCSPGNPTRAVDSSRHLLVVGNSYDHKDLDQTVDTLAACFPFELIRAVGLAEATHPNVEAVASGAVSEEEMERLYAQARVVVFPSFYEGFGFPIIRGLSYGRPVIARQSELLLELAAQYRGNGSLYSFSTPSSWPGSQQCLRGPLPLGRPGPTR